MLNYILYRIAQFIALALPLKLVYKIAVFTSDIHYLFADKDRKAVRENLKAIFPQQSDRWISGIRLRMSRNFAKYLVDFFRFSLLDREYIERNIRLKNIYYLDEALSRGKGVIILTAHLGNWELGGVVAALLGYPLWTVALPHKDRRVDDFFNFQRESKGMKVIPLGRAVRQCLNILKENKAIALAGDRDFTAKGMVVDFFGRPTFLPEGPAAFSLKTGASVVPGFMVRNKDDTFTLSFEKALEFSPPSNNKNKDLKERILQCNVIIESYIRKYPDQWYMFRRFWTEEAK